MARATPPLWHPRLWPTWLAIGLWWLVVQLPYSALRGLSHPLGDLLLVLPTRRRRIARTNLRLCFPELDELQRNDLLRRHFRSLALGLFETGIAWWWPVRRFDRIVSIKGIEHLHGLGERGALLLAFHFVHLDIGGSIVSRHFDIDGVYKSNRNPVFEYMQRRGREIRGVLSAAQSGHSGRLYDTRDMRGIIRALRQGRVLWYAPDQDFGSERSLFVPFFGVATATLIATSKLARAGDAAVVPMVQQRTADGRIEVRIMPPLEDFPGDSEERDTRRISELNEQLVRAQPADYLWVHRRFKTRPPGEPSPYG